MNMAMMIPPRTKNTRHGYISLLKGIYSCVTRGNSLIASCLELVDSCVDLLLCRLFSRGVIFTRARVLFALLSLRKNGGLLVVYIEKSPFLKLNNVV